ncbi:MAG: type IX secretion system protein PorQ [Dysgonamonadaceae bacterium]|jgi:hypothetical protein|nr:type IX secretion system protein PorQ [Dysgonamonadaceae bacterium]
MKKILTIFFLLISILPLSAQGGESVFTYLQLPSSARTAALGGYNVSVVEPDLSLVYGNPALLGTEMDLILNAGYLSYVGDVGVGNAAFAKSTGEKSAFGVAFNFANYGNMLETTENNEIIGDLKASDICGNLFFSRDLNEKIRGGVTAKFIYSNYYHNTAIGLGVDLGLSYYNEDNGLSFGVAGKNLGRQIKAYEEELADLPWDIQAGLSQKLNHAPIRYSVTFIGLNQWETPFFRHLVLGVEMLPTDNFWIAAGYNTKRASDLSLIEGNKFGGFSIGVGLRVKAFEIGCAVGLYHPGATSFMVSLSTCLADFKL